MRHHISLSAAAFVIFATLLLFVTPGRSETQNPVPLDFDTMLMMATLRIQGPNLMGTAFLVGNPRLTDQDTLRYTLVTAAHVLQGIKGEIAILYFRRQLEDGKWEVMPAQIKIREGEKPLWVKHEDADVAAMYIGVPEQARPLAIPINVLANDDLLAKYQIHPGDVLDCLGYPFNLETTAGDFPILRSGKIASYPLLPTKTTISFLLDFRVFPGNSGGPVYINFTGERISGSSIMMGSSFHFIVGLVSKEIRLTETRKLEYSTLQEQTPLGLAEVIHASLIRETIALLPPP